MKLRTDIIKQVRSIPKGELFDFKSLVYPAGKDSNVAVILHDLKISGEIKPLAKGVFYRPIESTFGLGKLPPRGDKVLDYVLKRYNGHAAGPYIYSRINLTEQVAFVVTIATPHPVRYFEFAGRRFACEKSPIGYITKDKYLVGCLDALKNIDSIPGCSEARAYKRMIRMVGNMSEAEMLDLYRYALLYPPRVRLFLFHIFKTIKKEDLAELLIGTIKKSVVNSFKTKRYLLDAD